ncbi:TetR/AcrR family transcriptional regulator [Porticoccus sp. W117]|uniref:TetR/AcrR family transcriptional regulator n=1 Tax=Porticoccus sp. W117 TaxID=3054777 RepID=UPI00259532EE|nr:TetR/AcrR family transcriptional regulator [Porticoccus sp. W117]MDM3869871.1 TetR/AcrR family transcriptional regulator [Porticoccus sp. W117]
MNSTTKPVTRSQQKQQDIVRAAEQVFIECGYRGASVDAIAERAQVSKRTIYNHFNNKESLFQHITNLLIEEVVRSSSVVYDREQPLDKQLFDILSGAWDALTSQKLIELVRVITSEYMLNPAMSRETMERITKGEEGMNIWLKAAIADKRLKPVDVEFAATMLRGMVHEYGHHPMLFFGMPAPSKKEKQHTLTEIVAVFLGRYQAGSE